MDWDIIGHQWAVDLLAKHIERENVRHAYLFLGPQGVGRRTLALRLAQALNCIQPPQAGKACLACRICKQIERMQQADLSVVQAENKGGTIKVDQVRELQRSLALAPYESIYRVALLLRFEEANHNAMNALLKTLEEPASKVILIVTAESAESLLPTIVSRCEVLRLRPVQPDQLSQELQRQSQLPVEQAQLLAHISGGRPGYAQYLHQNPDDLDKRTEWLDDHWRLLDASRKDRFDYCEKAAKDKDGLRVLLSVWLSFWRDILLRAADSSASIANPDRLDEIEHLATTCGLQMAHSVVSSLERTLGLLERNANVRLSTEVLLLDLPRR